MVAPVKTVIALPPPSLPPQFPILPRPTPVEFRELIKCMQKIIYNNVMDEDG
jgi:hypothetical protein